MTEPQLDELSLGQKRRFYQHMKAANSRYQRAYGVLEEAGIDPHMDVDGEGFLWTFTEGESCTGDVYGDAVRTYNEARE